MSSAPANSSPVYQRLRYGPHHVERISPADTMYTQTGRKLYVLGDIDGGFRPRSNPYDLYAFGRPDPRDPLAEKLQGVWAQPVKGLASYGYRVTVNGQPWKLEDAATFTQAYAWVEFEHRRKTLRATRRDTAALDLPLLLSTLTLINEGRAALEIELAFAVEFDLQDAWFTQLAQARNTGQAITVEHGRLVARADAAPERWAVVVGGLTPADHTTQTGEAQWQLTFSLRLEPGAQEKFVFGAAIESQAGADTALQTLNEGLPRHTQLQEEKERLYQSLLENGPRLESPDPALNMAFDLARTNLLMLEADTSDMGRYFYAGLEMFPFWFSNDGAYSLPGILASGLEQSALNHTRIGLAHLEEGRVPHQISPSGKIAFSGNAQETPQWVTSIWEAYRWTGDREFLAELFPGARKGIFDYVLGTIDPDRDGYPSGPGMVEVEGMGEEKLDSTAYTWSALHALAAMADELGDGQTALTARARADQIAARFDADWWDEPSGTYAMSLAEPGNTRQAVPHWAVIVPLEVGLATAEHAAVTLATLRQSYLNQWGLKHTAGSDERVWTLPTATLSRAAYRYDDQALGETMLFHLADTLQHGPIGLFHELIPQGACIIQLWSAATFLRGIIEDLLGIEVHAARHSLRITPCLPQGWQTARLRGLRFGTHRVHIECSAEQIKVEHLEGSAALQIEVGVGCGKRVTATLNPQEQSVLSISNHVK